MPSKRPVGQIISDALTRADIAEEVCVRDYDPNNEGIRDLLGSDLVEIEEKWLERDERRLAVG